MKIFIIIIFDDAIVDDDRDFGAGPGPYLTKKPATDILKGTAAVESPPGKGSTFMLRLPKKIIE